MGPIRTKPTLFRFKELYKSLYVETQLTDESRRIQLENYAQNTSHCDESLQKIEGDVMQSSL